MAVLAWSCSDTYSTVLRQRGAKAVVLLLLLVASDVVTVCAGKGSHSAKDHSTHSPQLQRSQDNQPSILPDNVAGTDSNPGTQGLQGDLNGMCKGTGQQCHLSDAEASKAAGRNKGVKVAAQSPESTPTVPQKPAKKEHHTHNDNEQQAETIQRLKDEGLEDEEPTQLHVLTAAWLKYAKGNKLPVQVIYEDDTGGLAAASALQLRKELGQGSYGVVWSAQESAGAAAQGSAGSSEIAVKVATDDSIEVRLATVQLLGQETKVYLLNSSDLLQEYTNVQDVLRASNSKHVVDYQRRGYIVIPLNRLPAAADVLIAAASTSAKVPKDLKRKHTQPDYALLPCVVMEKATYSLMDLVEGAYSARKDKFGAQAKRGLPIHTIKHIIRPVLRGIGDLSKAKVSHRDIKPENIFVFASKGWTTADVLAAPNQCTFKLGDFGLSELHQPDDVIPGHAVDVWCAGLLWLYCRLGVEVIEVTEEPLDYATEANNTLGSLEGPVTDKEIEWLTYSLGPEPLEAPELLAMDWLKKERQV